MRRQDREITDINVINDIIKNSPFMSVAMNTDNKSAPYIVTLNHAYDIIDGNIILYFHCASKGYKNELLKKNPNVAVTIVDSHGLLATPKGEDYSWNYRSVFGIGTCNEVFDEEKKVALDMLLIQNGYEGELSYPEKILNVTTVYKIELNKYTAKGNI